jgi:hypothetical protein
MLILTALLCFSIFKVVLFEPGLDALLGNPHTHSSLDIDRYNKALEPTMYIFFIAMVLLLQLLWWWRRRWEKAFKIGYYWHLSASGSFAIKGVRLFGQAKGYLMHFAIPSLPCAFLVPIHHPGALAILLPLE